MAARLRSDLQVSALQRQVEAEGLFFAVLARGHEEGGLIYIKWVEGRSAQIFTEETVDDARRWVRRGADDMAEGEANLFLDGERSFDPDLWVVEVSGPFAAAQRLLDPATP